MALWKIVPWIPAFRADGESPYKAGNVVNGHSRPYMGPNSWMSHPMEGSPEWIQLTWDEPKRDRDCSTDLQLLVELELPKPREDESPPFPKLFGTTAFSYTGWPVAVHS